MTDYPVDFVAATTPLDSSLPGLAPLIEELDSKGYVVHLGLTSDYVNQIIKMCLQPSIKEYCPRDYSKRFANRENAQAWISKGRAVFLLLKKDDLSLAGYAWIGSGSSPKAPGGETTFALRVGEQSQGQGLAAPYMRALLMAAKTIYESQNIWLEAWESNAGAVHIYHKVGFQDIASESGQRLRADGTTVADTRIYMRLPADNA